MSVGFTCFPSPSHQRGTGIIDGCYHIQLYTRQSELRSFCFHDKCFTHGASPNSQDQFFHYNSLMINLILSLHCRDSNLWVGVHGVDRQKHMSVHLMSPMDLALSFMRLTLWSFSDPVKPLITWQSEWHVNYLSTVKLRHRRKEELCSQALN